uniref:Si:dkey-4c23.5 n=2 Tax=Astyanax mexicanus TaxID=7994 RepID=A0A8B9JKY7_ASTMX
MGFKWDFLPLIILLNIPGSLGKSNEVICSSQTICALRESAVYLKCSYSNTIKPQQSFWFSSKLKAKWRNEEDPEDLALDSDYAGRVTYKTSSSSSINSTLTLRIRDLRERDSGEYQLMIITESGEKYSSSTAITLTVSDLQIKMISDTDRKWTLNCSASCSLTSEPLYYYWYHNGQYSPSANVDERTWSLYQTVNPGSYSCSSSQNPEARSSSVCVSGENCWSVIYSERRVCVLEDSSVDFPCTYSYPSGQTVTESFWFYFQPGVNPNDLSKEERFAGRVEFLGDKERNCTLRIRNVTKRDSGEYRFRFSTNPGEIKFAGRPGVILSVTDLQVKMSPSSPSEGQTVTLTCSSTCTLPNNPTYIWYKNGQPVTNKPTRYNKLYLESTSPEDVLQYSCALGGPEESRILIPIAVGVSVFLVLILITGWIWLRRRRSSPGQDNCSPRETGQGDSGPVYSNVSALTMTSDLTQKETSDSQDGVHYSSIHFKHSRTLDEFPPTTSTFPLNPTKDQEVQYSAVKFCKDSAAP